VKVLSRTKAKKKEKPWYFKLENQAMVIITFFIVATAYPREVAMFFNVALLAGMAYGFYRLFIKGKSVRFHRVKDLYEVDKMDGHDFEHYLAPLFERLGYRAEVTKGSGDFGADLILRKKGKKYVVQAKRYSGSIGVSAVQEVVGALGYYKAHGAMVVTNNYFTPAAEELAKHNRVQLIDRDELAHMMKGRRPRRW
jgi:restriction system protein